MVRRRATVAMSITTTERIAAGSWSYVCSMLSSLGPFSALFCKKIHENMCTCWRLGGPQPTYYIPEAYSLQSTQEARFPMIRDIPKHQLSILQCYRHLCCRDSSTASGSPWATGSRNSVTHGCVSWRNAMRLYDGTTGTGSTMSMAESWGEHTSVHEFNGDAAPRIYPS